MPTGYTSDVTDETTLEQFAMSCARAFGALITMRDEPHGAPIPERFEPSDHHVENLKKAEARLAELTSMTLKQAAPLAEAEYRSALREHTKERKENAVLKARYNRLLRLVKAWPEPTPDHVGLKEFMIEQLTSSIKHDCYDREPPVPKEFSPTAWLERQIAAATWSRNYHRDEGEKEVARARERTNWVRDLRASFKKGK